MSERERETIEECLERLFNGADLTDYGRDEILEVLRAPMTAPTPAGEEMGDRDEIDLADLAARLKEHVDGIRKTRAFLNENGPALRLHDDLLMASRALLSSPRVERARALEEAAKVADEMAANRDRVSGVAAHACRAIASRIRSLSPTDKQARG